MISSEEISTFSVIAICALLLLSSIAVSLINTNTVYPKISITPSDICRFHGAASAFARTNDLTLHRPETQVRDVIRKPSTVHPQSPRKAWYDDHFLVSPVLLRKTISDDRFVSSVVRVSPDEVSLSDRSAAQAIYKIGSPYAKSTWYTKFSGAIDAGPYQNVFNQIDVKSHSEHRCRLAHGFSAGWMKSMEPSITSKVRLAITRMAEEYESQNYFDAWKWFTFMGRNRTSSRSRFKDSRMIQATDVIGEASFGESFEMLEKKEKDQYILDLESIAFLDAFYLELPAFGKLLGRLPVGPARGMGKTVKRMETYANKSIDRYWRQWQEDPDSVPKTILTKIFGFVEDGTVDKRQLVSDARGNILAGTDTTAIAATYAVWLLSSHPSMEQQVINEVCGLRADFVDEDIKGLVTLNNVISETLRLRGPITSALPRAVPPAGCTFDSHFIPGGITVGIPSWTLHRNPAVWSDPESFQPDRWLNPTQEMRDYFLPWGGRTRACLGIHLARLELRSALAHLYRQFPKGLQPSMQGGFTADDMFQSTYILSPPKGKRCFLEPR